MGSLKKILVVRASGGLSNRLQAVICGIAYCLLTQRAICIDWRDGLYSDDFSNVFPLWFNVEGVDSLPYEEVAQIFEKNASVNPQYWKDWLTAPIAVEYMFHGNDHMQSENIAKTSINLEQLDLEDEIVVFWGWDTRCLTPLITMLKENFAPLANLEQNAIERYLLKNYIKPLPSLSLEAQNFFDKHFKKPPVGIHIRYTDLQSPLPRMIEHLSKVASTHEKIFLCTDNEHVEKMIRKIFPYTVTHPKIFQGNDIPLHSYVEGVSNVQKGHEAMIDMLLLSRCDQIIHYERSSFAKIPILYSELSSEHIHNVRL